MCSARYYVQDDPPAKLRLTGASEHVRLLSALRRVYPRLREVTRAQFRAAPDFDPTTDAPESKT